MESNSEKRIQELQQQLIALMTDLAAHPLCPPAVRKMITMQKDVEVKKKRILEDAK